MNREELKKQLDLLNVPEGSYSLEGELNADSIILYHSYHEWRVFYMDERGGRNKLRIYPSEAEACQRIYEMYLDRIRIFGPFKKTT